MKKFVLTPLAARDIDEIWEYLAEDSIDYCRPSISGD